MKLPMVAAAAVVLICSAAGNSASGADGHAGPNCPYGQVGLRPGCGSNPNSDPIPTSLGGKWLSSDECGGSLVDALASLYAYNDPNCDSNADSVDPEIRTIGDAINYLPDYYKERAEQNNFHATLYCDVDSNTLILAYRGSVEPDITRTFDSSQIADWYGTNFAQHLGIRPLQYEVASDVADLLKRQWARGEFDGLCGKGGRPGLVLSGHSKGGGQAVFAAVHLMLNAIVFNADPVNPLIFSDWALSRDAPAILQWLQNTGQNLQSVLGCLPTPLDDELNRYYSIGRIRDIRMINDPLAKYFLPYCDISHPSIEWLPDTLACSTTDGHAITTVVQELQACAASGTGEQGTRR